MASVSRSRWPELLWAAFASANAVVIVLIPAGATIPFHNIWVSLTLLYGFRLWSLGATVPILVAVCLGTGSAMTATVVTHGLAVDELTEVPMMAAMFVAMVWHARRHQGALDALRRSTAREHDFVRDASHQLRTPITIARGHAELVRAATAQRQTIDDVDVVIEELDRLSRISDRLLIVATAEHRSFTRAPIDLSHVVETRARRWEPAADRDWRVEIAAKGTVSGDAERLGAALDAMIENAVKATGPGDGIAVVLRAEGDQAVVEVVDAGVGIPAEDLDRIFDRFWTRTHPNASRGGGTGLGLAAVKAIATAHDGAVEAVAMPRGGATVRMRLGGFVPQPRPDEHPQPAPRPTMTAPKTMRPDVTVTPARPVART
jgi:two-component system OmpR family sensor kinase